MKFTAMHKIPAPRENVFNAITDPAVLQRCIEGCEQLVKTSEDSYDAHMKIGLGGMKGNYVGKVQLRDVRPPESYTLIISGKGKPGFVNSTAKISLVERDGQTELHCEADGQVGGLIAAIGSRLIEGAAKRMMDDFFKKLAAEVSAKAG